MTVTSKRSEAVKIILKNYIYLDGKTDKVGYIINMCLLDPWPTEQLNK